MLSKCKLPVSIGCWIPSSMCRLKNHCCRSICCTAGWDAGELRTLRPCWSRQRWFSLEFKLSVFLQEWVDYWMNSAATVSPIFLNAPFVSFPVWGKSCCPSTRLTTAKPQLWFECRPCFCNDGASVWTHCKQSQRPWASFHLLVQQCACCFWLMSPLPRLLSGCSPTYIVRFDLCIFGLLIYSSPLILVTVRRRCLQVF